jgi:hypothetical protein
VVKYMTQVKVVRFDKLFACGIGGLVEIAVNDAMALNDSGDSTGA